MQTDSIYSSLVMAVYGKPVMQYLLSDNTYSYTCTESKGWNLVSEQFLLFSFKEGLCYKQEIRYFYSSGFSFKAGKAVLYIDFSACALVLLMKPVLVVIENSLKSCWHIILSSTALLKPFLTTFWHCPVTEKVYYCVQCVCPLGALPSALTLTVEPGAFLRF